MKEKIVSFYLVATVVFVFATIANANPACDFKGTLKDVGELKPHFAENYELLEIAQTLVNLQITSCSVQIPNHQLRTLKNIKVSLDGLAVSYKKLAEKSL